jgi:hypothetical protein
MKFLVVLILLLALLSITEGFRVKGNNPVNPVQPFIDMALEEANK